MTNLWKINGNYYDFTNFMEKHSGGKYIIEKYRGMDCTNILCVNHFDKEYVKNHIDDYLVKNVNKDDRSNIYFRSNNKDYNFDIPEQNYIQIFIFLSFILLSLLGNIYFLPLLLIIISLLYNSLLVDFYILSRFKKSRKLNILLLKMLGITDELYYSHIIHEDKNNISRRKNKKYKKNISMIDTIYNFNKNLLFNIESISIIIYYLLLIYFHGYVIGIIYIISLWYFTSDIFITVYTDRYILNMCNMYVYNKEYETYKYFLKF